MPQILYFLLAPGSPPIYSAPQNAPQDAARKLQLTYVIDQIYGVSTRKAPTKAANPQIDDPHNWNCLFYGKQNKIPETFSRIARLELSLPPKLYTYPFRQTTEFAKQLILWGI